MEEKSAGVGGCKGQKIFRKKKERKSIILFTLSSMEELKKLKTILNTSKKP